ncbi:metallophosphoesterase domain-containing protein 1 [Earliella scabrosa]|nr:metallophosphoesterase domain-containing protein 1 [Earliella scabrosa]
MVRRRPGSIFSKRSDGLDAIVYRSPSSTWDKVRYDPWLFVARKAYAACTPQLPPLPPENQDDSTARIVCISDTHSLHDEVPPLPPGDILIHAGDLTATGSVREVDAALAWLHAAPHPHKIVIAGNHDRALENPTTRDTLLAQYPSLTYLEDTSALLTIRGRLLSVYGSPRTPLHGAGSFHYPYGAQPWAHVPAFTDILVTHGPPAFHLDNRRAGCPRLLEVLHRRRPALHVFGHIHASRGVECASYGRAQAAYERVCRGKNRWQHTAKALWLLGAALWAKVRGRPRFRRGEDTVLVNASSLGGFRDDLRREAIVVDIPLPDRAS